MRDVPRQVLHDTPLAAVPDVDTPVDCGCCDVTCNSGCVTAWDGGSVTPCDVVCLVTVGDCLIMCVFEDVYGTVCVCEDMCGAVCEDA